MPGVASRPINEGHTWRKMNSPSYGAPVVAEEPMSYTEIQLSNIERRKISLQLPPKMYNPYVSQRPESSAIDHTKLGIEHTTRIANEMLERYFENDHGRGLNIRKNPSGNYFENAIINYDALNKKYTIKNRDPLSDYNFMRDPERRKSYVKDMTYDSGTGRIDIEMETCHFSIQDYPHKAYPANNSAYIYGAIDGLRFNNRSMGPEINTLRCSTGEGDVGINVTGGNGHGLYVTGSSDSYGLHGGESFLDDGKLSKWQIKRNLTIIVKSRADPIRSASQSEQRAIESLREVITEIEFRKYLKFGFILVKGCSGRVYQIFRNKEHTKVWEKGKLVEEVCVRIKRDLKVPPTDNVIAFRTMVLCDENEFKKIGNVYNMAA